ncbi:hypothetical protein G7Y89_g8829 [Cudoniella acicularis]|uniref:Exonuclease domain-containing protein n=1 Tax=Cudoniella acicularis TaxID=354080 RepID=A0A8H4RI54_9HELO|nr:hypothetical protein G7Y89_g8829 [Cudoniella acicularis]
MESQIQPHSSKGRQPRRHDLASSSLVPKSLDDTNPGNTSLILPFQPHPNINNKHSKADTRSTSTRNSPRAEANHFSQDQHRQNTTQKVTMNQSRPTDFSSGNTHPRPPRAFHASPSTPQRQNNSEHSSQNRNTQHSGTKMAAYSPSSTSSRHSSSSQSGKKMSGATPKATLPFRPAFSPMSESRPSTSSLVNFPRRPTTTSIKHSDEYMLQLRSLLHSKTVLQENGYVLAQLSESDLHRKKKCLCCKKAVFKSDPKSEEKKAEKDKSKARKSIEEINADNYERTRTLKEGADCAPKLQLPASGRENEKAQEVMQEVNEAKEAKASVSDPEKKPAGPPAPVFRCKFHDGVVRNMMWTCCGKHLFSDPCKKNEFHTPINYGPGQLEAAWKFHKTPTTTLSSDIRYAVAIDCEMAVANSGDSELIRVTLIDYFSSEVLIDSLVYPDEEIQDYKTRFSGVTRRDMEDARRQRRCLMGKEEARLAVWKFVGPKTIVVGHSAHNDLTSLRWIHKKVIDTWLMEDLVRRAEQQIERERLEKEKKEKLEKEAAEKKERDEMMPWIKENKAPEKENTEQGDRKGKAVSKEKDELPAKKEDEEKQKKQKKRKGTGPLCLKTLTRERLGRDIQTGGKNGHDSFEDALAARDLAHWKVLNGGSNVAVRDDTEASSEK